MHMHMKMSLAVCFVVGLLAWGQGKAEARQSRVGSPARVGSPKGVDFNRMTRAQQLAIRTTATVRGVRRVSRAVIAIVSTKVAGKNPFYGPAYGGRRGPRKKKQYSLGSGVIVNAQGYAVTNEHVISRATEIRVQLANGKRYKARVVGAAREYDLAVIKIQTNEKLPVAQLGRSADLMAGETAIAIGTPFGLTQTVSRGVISATNRSFKIKKRRFSAFIQTDAAINPGNSGGPLINTLGQVIGINTAVHRGGPGIGFAIPVDRVRRVVSDLLAFGRVRGAYLGMSVATASGRRGVVVIRVASGGPAHRAGLRKGDVILSLKGVAIRDVYAFRRVARSLVPGGRVRVKLKRGTVTLVVGTLTARRSLKLFERRLGVTLGNASSFAGSLKLRTTRGVVISSIVQTTYYPRCGDLQHRAQRRGLASELAAGRCDPPGRPIPGASPEGPTVRSRPVADRSERHAQSLAGVQAILRNGALLRTPRSAKIAP